MSPEVEAAIIAGGVGILTVLVSLYGTRKASKDTKDGLNRQLTEQRSALDETLKEQRVALNETLKEQREALQEQRTRTLNERFATAADRLGSDKPPAVQLAGVYAMAGLAEDWHENRQTCVDVLCAYLRMPYQPDPGDESAEPERLSFRAGREVRQTVIRVITAHLRDGVAKAKSWQGLDLDFTGVVFDDGDFMEAVFSGGSVSFRDATFSAGTVSFRGASFSGGTVSFGGAQFSGGMVNFSRATFSGGAVDFSDAELSEGQLYLGGATFSGSMVDFAATFSGSTVDFISATFAGGTIYFTDATFARGTISFRGAQFSGSEVLFFGTNFSGSQVLFNADFSGGTVSFANATFAGGTVDFSGTGDWSRPPEFDWGHTPPASVKLPDRQDQSPPLTS